MQISQSGIDLIKDCEGYGAFPYNDSAGHATIGYGTLLHRGPVTDADRQQYARGLSKPDAEQLLINHIHLEVEPGINSAVRVPLSQCQYDALCSFVYNMGVASFDNSTLLRKLNMGQYSEIPGQLRRWVYAGGEISKGLANRREKEISLWNGQAMEAANGN